MSQEALDERDERIHHLEEVNRTLKQTNDELTEELGELQQKFELLTVEVCCCCVVVVDDVIVYLHYENFTEQLEQIKSTSKTLQDESKELIANLNVSTV